MIKTAKQIVLTLAFASMAYANECTSGRLVRALTSTKAELKTCSGWALNRLPLVKEWIH